MKPGSLRGNDFGSLPRWLLSKKFVVASVEDLFGWEEWKERSQKGEVCGMLNCSNPPVKKCHHCGNWYCDEHSFHIKMFGGELRKEEWK